MEPNYDVVLVRAALGPDGNWVQDLLEMYAIVRTHDLEYYRLNRRESVGVSVVELEVDDALAGVADVFATYRNHWSYDPLIPSFPLVDAYVEWAAALLKGGGAALAIPSSGERVAGIAILHRTTSGFDVALAGVRPASRGEGVYRLLTRGWADWAWAHDAAQVTISTESWNRPVIKTWISEGYSADRSYATYHLIRRAALPLIRN